MERTTERSPLRIPIVLGGAVAALSSILAAQPLIGFTARNFSPMSSRITSQVMCNPALTVCNQALPPPSQNYAGGAAYSPWRHSIWHTEGTRLLELTIDNCKRVCLRPTFRILGPQSLASGLTINAARNEMYQVESRAGLAGVVTYRFVSPSAVCPSNGRGCVITLPSSAHFAGAITHDGRRDLIYVAASIFNVANPANFLLVYKRGDPNCRPFCRIRVPLCHTTHGRLQAIRALAYDECNDIIYISDGRQTSVQSVIWSPSQPCPRLLPLSCCTLASLGELWAGFDVTPVRHGKLGTSCTPPNCPSCPSMSFDPIGKPVVGNTQFKLRLSGAPANGAGYLLLNAGPCLPISFGCGQLFPALAGILVLGPVPVGGAAPCGGQTDFSLPIPNNYALCGLKFCAQAGVVCPAGGLALTNGLIMVVDS